MSTKTFIRLLICVMVSVTGSNMLFGQTKRPNQTGIINLDSLRWRDMCVLPDPASKTYYMVGPGGRNVRCYTSKDLKNWEGPKMIYTAPQDVWGDIQ